MHRVLWFKAARSVSTGTAAASLPTVCAVLRSCCRAVLMLLPRQLTHSKEFKGSRENPEIFLQLRSTVSRNLCSLVIHKLYQILGVEKAKARAVLPHSVFALDTVPRYWNHL